MEVFFINVGHFEKYRGFSNTFSDKWRRLIISVRLL
jgi:hypothetical protein